MLFEKTERVTDVSFVLDDETGRIDCHRWRVTDYNEIANHFADCMYVHCYNTKAKKMQDAAPQVTGHMPNSAINTPSKGYQPTSSNHFSVQYNMDGIKGIDKLVLDYLQQPACIAREKGVHRAELAQQMNVPEHKILEAIESLGSEGLIYSTIDEFHYKSTANG